MRSFRLLLRKIVDTGITEDISEIEKVRIRLVNIIALFGSTIYFLFFLGYLFLNVFWSWFPNLIGSAYIATILFFNHRASCKNIIFARSS